MIKISNVRALNFDGAIKGMRNPLNSHNRSDSYWEKVDDEMFGNEMCDNEAFKYAISNHPEIVKTLNNIDGNKMFRYMIGANDLNLAMRLVAAGPTHRKFLRQIIVCMNINAPLYWWKEFDTYKVGTTANSESTMHTLTKKPLTLTQFSTDKMNEESLDFCKNTVKFLEYLRLKFIETNDKKYWYSLMQSLPTSFNQCRSVTLNYEVLTNIYETRANHKLDEWKTFCEFIETMPYSQFITGINKKSTKKNLERIQ